MLWFGRSQNKDAVQCYDMKLCVAVVGFFCDLNTLYHAGLQVAVFAVAFVITQIEQSSTFTDVWNDNLPEGGTDTFEVFYY